MIEMNVNSVRFNPANHQFLLLLEESSAEKKRLLPLSIGPVEADSIVLKLQDSPVSGSSAYDMISSILTSVGASVNFVLVSEIRGNAFHAKINLRANNKEIDIDARPSDAIALALRTTAPIYVDESLLSQAGISSERLNGQVKPAKTGNQTGETSGQINEQELKKLSAFRELVEGLDLDNLGNQ